MLAQLAQSGVRVPLSAVCEGFAQAQWPGRLEPAATVRRLWWDGAHNLDGVRRLVQAWRDEMKLDPPSAIVFAVALDKDARAMLQRLRAFAPQARLLLTRTRSDRALPIEMLAVHAAALGTTAEVHESVELALAAVLDHGESGRGQATGRVLLTGSLIAVGEAMERVGGGPGELQ